MVWFCEWMLNGLEDEKQMLQELESWHVSVVELLTGREEDLGVLWRLLLRGTDWNSEMLAEETNKFANSFRGKTELGMYFHWPSFLRDLLAKSKEETRGNKRRKSNTGSIVPLSYYPPLSRFKRIDPEIQHRNDAWLSFLGYILTHAYLDRPSAGTTIHEVMDSLQSALVSSLPTALGLESQKRRALLSGMAGCLIDKLGEALAVATLSLKDGEEEEKNEMGQQPQLLAGETDSGSILGVEVAQIVNMLSIHE